MDRLIERKIVVMSYRSWLKDVTHVSQIDPWFTTLDGCHDDYEKMDIARWDKLVEYWKHPLPVDPEFHKFFNSRLHDSQFFNLTRSKNQVTVTINDLDAELLVLEICDVLELQHPQVPIPIDLVFHDVAYCTTLRSDPTHTLRYDNVATALPKDKDFHMTFIRGWFFQQQDRLQWVAQVHSWRVPSKKLDCSIYILIDCASATATDRRLPALKKLFGPNIVPLWNDYLNRIDFPETPPYYPQYAGGFYDYLERRLPAHNLTWEALRPIIK